MIVMFMKVKVFFCVSPPRDATMAPKLSTVFQSRRKQRLMSYHNVLMQTEGFLKLQTWETDKNI